MFSAYFVLLIKESYAKKQIFFLLPLSLDFFKVVWKIWICFILSAISRLPRGRTLSWCTEFRPAGPRGLFGNEKLKSKEWKFGKFGKIWKVWQIWKVCSCCGNMFMLPARPARPQKLQATPAWPLWVESFKRGVLFALDRWSAMLEYLV